MIPRRIVLTGMMCSGKTTVGKRLAAALGWDFVDTDRLIEQRSGLKIPEIFRAYGEDYFRRLEKEVLQSAMRLENTVIATGGGVVTDSENLKLIGEQSLGVYLEVPLKELVRRCRGKSDVRPLLKGGIEDNLRKILNERREIYERVGNTVDAVANPWTVAQSILYLIDWDIKEELDGIEKILLGPGILKDLGNFTKGDVRYFAQRRAYRLFGEFLPESVFVLPDGDRAKSLKTLTRIYEFLLNSRATRGTTVVSIGGGAASDVVGFAASTFKRGVRFINAPTTLLAQVDAGLGGKNALNFRGIKNVIGTFYHPDLILIDPLALLSLDGKDFRQGFAEIVKSAIIGETTFSNKLEDGAPLPTSPHGLRPWGEESGGGNSFDHGDAFFKFLEANVDKLLRRNLQTLTEVIKRTAKVKLGIVEEDFRESTGKRKLLNLGHTLGHAYEVILGISHGEAVAIGLVKAIEIGIGLGITETGLLERTKKLLGKFGLLRKLPDAERVDERLILEKIVQDKKASRGKIDFVIPRKPGDVIINPMEPDEIIRLKGGLL